MGPLLVTASWGRVHNRLSYKESLGLLLMTAWRYRMEMHPHMEGVVAFMQSIVGGMYLAHWHPHNTWYYLEMRVQGEARC